MGREGAEQAGVRVVCVGGEGWGGVGWAFCCFAQGVGQAGQPSCGADLHPPATLLWPVLQDAALAWFAANFMQQKHPLVVAMQQQVRCGGHIADVPPATWPRHHT